MKKLLLASTSLAVLAYAGSAMAEEASMHCGDYGCTFTSNGDISGDYDYASNDNYVTSNTMASQSLNVVDYAAFTGTFTLDHPTTITATDNAPLSIEGYLTQTLTGSDISGVDVTITQHYFEDEEEPYTDGALVLGNSLTVGNVNMTDGTRIVLYTDGNAGTFGYTDNKTLTIADGKALTFEGNNIVAGKPDQTLTIDGDGEVLNKGTLTLKKPVTFDTDVSNVGEIIVNDGAVFNNLINVGTLTLASNAGGSIDNGGIIDLQDNVLTGDVTAYEGSTIKTLVSSVTDPTTATYGKITDALTYYGDEGTANIEVSVLQGVDIGDELTLQFADSVDNVAKYTLKDGMYNIALDDGGVLTVTNKTTAEKTETLKAVGGNGNNVSAFDAWDKADLTSAPDAVQVLQQRIAEASGDAAQLVGILKEITPEAPTVAAGAAVSGVTNTMGVIGANAFAGAAPTGKSSGDPKLKNAVWAQGLYNKAEFNKTGYDWDAETWGFAAGADHTFDGGFKLGAGYSYTDADIKTDSSKTPAKTHTIFAYGEYKPGKTWYVNGILSYSFGEYKPKSGTVTGEYDVNTFGAQLMGGYSFDWITPEAGLRYFHVAQDGYTDSIGQKIGKSTSNIWTAVIGAKASKEFKVDSMKLIPEARLAATYDLKQGEDVTTVGVFGTNYEVKGKNLSRFGFEVGAGLTADWGAFELTAKYEGKFRSDYTDNTGILEAKYNF